MTAKGLFRGHEAFFDGLAQQWRFRDTGEFVSDRACFLCGKNNTPEGHDACLGQLPGVTAACCGHGDNAAAYVQFVDGTIVREFAIDDPTKK